MRSFSELRELAWKRLWADHWFGRLFGGGLLLSLCGYAVNTVIGGILNRLGVQTWQDYYLARVQNLRDLTTPVPNLTHDFIFQATSSGMLSMFIGYIMAGIASYGTAVILLKCLKNEESGWLGAAFGGFRDPFGMLWLFVRYILIFVGWGLLCVFPLGLVAGVCYPLLKSMTEVSFVVTSLISVLISLAVTSVFLAFLVPFYRYRFLFLVKAEHPDWSAGECIRSCRDLTDGHKMESFRLDCSYWKPITLVLLLVIGVVFAGVLAALFRGNVLLAALFGFASFIGAIACVAASVVLGQYISVGQGFLCEDLKNNQTTEQSERNA